MCFFDKFSDGLASLSSPPVSMASGEIFWTCGLHGRSYHDLNRHVNFPDQEIPERGVACYAHGPAFDSCHLCHCSPWSQGLFVCFLFVHLGHKLPMTVIMII